MWTSEFPVEAGVAVSIGRPGRNVTGMTAYAGAGVLGKFLHMLHEAKPSIRRVAWIRTYAPPFFPHAELESANIEIRDSAQRLGLDVGILEFARAAQVDAAIVAIKTQPANALVLTSGASLYPIDRSSWTWRDKIAFLHLRMPDRYRNHCFCVPMR